MQIFELTSGKKTLKEYDPNRSPVKPNFGTGVGPGVGKQMTATPTVKSATAPTSNTVNQADPANPNIAAQTPYVQGRAGQGANPTRFAKYDPNTSAVANLDQGMRAMAAPRPEPRSVTDLGMANLSQGMRAMTAPMAEPETPTRAAGVYGQPTYNVPLANVPTTNTMMPTNMSATGNPTATPAAATAGTSGTDVTKTPTTFKKTSNGMSGNPFVDELIRHNAYAGGVQAMLPDQNTDVKVDKEGQILVHGKPYNANNPEHVKAYQTYMANGGKNVAPTPKTPPATPPTNTTPGTPPATPPTNTTPGTPPEPSGVELALKKLGYSPQGAAAMAAKVPPGMSEQDAIKLALSGKLRESLTWSRGFDPSQTLLKKIRQL